MTVITSCRHCGCEFEPDSAAIRRGQWRTCEECLAGHRLPPEYPVGGRCDRCRKPLRDKRSYLCLECAAVSFS